MKTNFSVSTIDPKVDTLLDRRHAERLLDRRHAARVLAHYPVTYRNGGSRQASIEEGLLHDVSKTGCSVSSQVFPSAGSMITLTLYLNDGEAPISLVGTPVCWATEHRFGVMFPEMTSEERRRLEVSIWKRVTLLGSQPQRAVFRIA